MFALHKRTTAHMRVLLCFLFLFLATHFSLQPYHRHLAHCCAPCVIAKLVFVMAHAEEAAASPAQPSPAPTPTPTADLEEIVLPSNVTKNPKEIPTIRRSIRRIEDVIGQKPWEWLAEFEPKQ